MSTRGPEGIYRKPVHLYETPPDPTIPIGHGAFSRLIDAGRLAGIPELNLAALIEMHERYPHALRMLTQERDSGALPLEEYAQKAGKLEDLLVKMSFAQRLYNELKGSLFLRGFSDRVSQGTDRASADLAHARSVPLGAQIRSVFEDPKYADHGRRHEATYAQILKTTLSFLYEVEGDFDVDLVCAAVLTCIHDGDQLLAIHRNIHGLHQSAVGTPLTIKAGHAEAGGLIPELFRDELIEQGLLQDENLDENRHDRVARICAIANIIMMVHDEPERAIARLRATEHKAYTIIDNLITPVDGDTVYTWYLEGTLDLFTTSPSQRLDIARRKKQGTGHDTGGSVYGLHPEFEKWKKKEFDRVTHDKLPSFINAHSAFRRNVEILGAAHYFSDLVAMLYPAESTVVRKLQVQKAQSRPLYNGDGGAMQRLTEGNGEQLGSDWERAMFESTTLVRLLHNTPLVENETFKRMVALTVMKSTWLTHSFYLQLMQHKDAGTAAIQGVFMDRLYVYADKLLRSMSVSNEILSHVRSNMGRSHTIQDTIAAFQRELEIHGVAAGASSDFVARLRVLQVEMNHALGMYLRKPIQDSDRDDTGNYLDSARDACQRDFEVFIVELAKTAGVSLEGDTVAFCRAIPNEALLPVKGGGDSGGSIEDAKVILRAVSPMKRIDNDHQEA